MSLFPKIKVNEAVSAAFPSAAFPSLPRHVSVAQPPALRLPGQRAASLNAVWRELNPRPAVPVKPTVAKAERLIAALPEVPLYQRYTVSHREDLDAVASRHPGVSPAEIAAANQLTHFRLEAGQSLVIPSPALRAQPEFQKTLRYYKSEYHRYSQLYGAPDDTLLQARQKDIGVKATQANYQNVITEQGIGLKSTQIHVDENAAQLQRRLEAQLNQELIDKAEADKAEAERAEVEETETSNTQTGKRRAQKTQPSKNIAPLRRMENLGNTADGRLVNLRIELDADKAKELRWATYEYEKTAYSLGATDKGMWGNLWEATTHRYSASLSATKEAFGEVTGNVTLQREAAVARMNADHRSNQASQRAHEQGAVDDYRQIQTSADLGKYMGGLALGTLPYMGEIALGAMTGGTTMGLRATATALQITRARMGAGFVAGYPSGVGNLALAQHEQGSGPNAWASFGLGVPFSAANLFGVEGMAARLSLARNSIARLDGISGAKGAASRATATTAVMGFSEMSTEIGQTFIERYGQLQADISQNFFSQDFKHELPNVMVGAALLGGTMGGGLGGWRRKAGAAPGVEQEGAHNKEVNATQIEADKVDAAESPKATPASKNSDTKNSWWPIGGPVVGFKLKTYLPQAIAMPTDPDGMGLGVNIHPSYSGSSEQIQTPVGQKEKNQEVDPSRLARALLNAEHGTLEELVFQMKQREARASAMANGQPVLKYVKSNDRQSYSKLKELVRANNGSLDALAPWLQGVLKSGETPEQSIQSLIERPAIWGQGRAHVPQVDSSLQAIEQMDAPAFKVLEKLSQDLSVEEIGVDLKITKPMVQRYLNTIFKALGVVSRSDLLARYPEGLDGLTQNIKEVKLKRGLRQLSADFIEPDALSAVRRTDALPVLADVVAGVEEVAILLKHGLQPQSFQRLMRGVRADLNIKNSEDLTARYAGKDLQGDLHAEYVRRIFTQSGKGGPIKLKLGVEAMSPPLMLETIKGILARPANKDKLPYLATYLGHGKLLLKDAAYEKLQLEAIEALAKQFGMDAAQLPGFLARAFGTLIKRNGLDRAIKYINERAATPADRGFPVNKLQAQSRVVSILLDGGKVYFLKLLQLIQAEKSIGHIARDHSISVGVLTKDMKDLASQLGLKAIPSHLYEIVHLIGMALEPAVPSNSTLENLLKRIVEQPKEWVKTTRLIRSTHSWTIYKKLSSEEQHLLHQYAVHEYDLPALAIALGKSEKNLNSQLQKVLKKLGHIDISTLQFSYGGDLRQLDQPMALYAERELQRLSENFSQSNEKVKKGKSGREVADVGRVRWPDEIRADGMGDFFIDHPVLRGTDEHFLNSVAPLNGEATSKAVAEKTWARLVSPDATKPTDSLGLELNWLLGLQNGLRQDAKVSRSMAESRARKLLFADGKVLREALLYLKHLEQVPPGEIRPYYGATDTQVRKQLLDMTHNAQENLAKLDEVIRSVAVDSETPEQVITNLLENRHEWRKARAYLRQIDMEGLGDLFDRELEVLGFVVRGFKQDQIASELSLSKVMIEEYRLGAFSKLGFYGYNDIKSNYGLEKIKYELALEKLRRERRS